jgi:hypothetical protein
MTTAFAATTRSAPRHFAKGWARATYSLQMPDSLTASGDTWDISAHFSVVADVACNQVISAAAQMGYQLFALGTAVTGGIAPATMTISAARSAATSAVFDEANTSDLSTTHAAALVAVLGKAA